MKKQNGFSAVIVLLSILVVTAIGFTGYYVWNTQQESNKQDSQVKQEPLTTNITSPEYINIDSLGIKIPASNVSRSFTYEASNDGVIIKSSKLRDLMNTTCGSNNGGDGVVAIISKEVKPLNINPNESPVGKSVIKDFDKFVIWYSDGPGNGWVCGHSDTVNMTDELMNELDNYHNQIEEVLKTAVLQ
jgi:hypothetical protein